MFRLTTTTLLCAAFAASGANAQRLVDPRPEAPSSAAVETFVVRSRVHVVLHPDSKPAVAKAAKSNEEAARPRFSWEGVAHVVGGALVGGFVGYVGAQIVRGDWERENDSSLRTERTIWTAAGALLGVVGSQLVGRTTAPGTRPKSLTPFAREQRVLSTAEIRASSATTAYELISTLRPQWLLTRGTGNPAETTRGVIDEHTSYVIPGLPQIIVYMNDIRLGGVETLRGVLVNQLTGARFLSAREATYRYGGGNTHGAILLDTGVRAPSADGQ